MRLRRIFLTLLGTGLVMGAGCNGLLPPAAPSTGWHDPLDHMTERDLKLTFGLYVTPDPEQNPIDPPERFTGYHTALDIEILPGEQTTEVPVYAICDGEVVYKADVNGYGGTFIQQCTYEDEQVTVLYGHLDLVSITPKVGEALQAGDSIGNLGEAYTAETSQNRKHLHLGIHKGTDIELRGYVQNESELQAYIDPKLVLNYR